MLESRPQLKNWFPKRANFSNNILPASPKTFFLCEDCDKALGFGQMVTLKVPTYHIEN